MESAPQEPRPGPGRLRNLAVRGTALLLVIGGLWLWRSGTASEWLGEARAFLPGSPGISSAAEPPDVAPLPPPPEPKQPRSEPESEPEPRPEPEPEPEIIRPPALLEIITDPPGAMVMREDELSLGERKTPVSLQVDPTDDGVLVVFLEGYVAQTLDLATLFPDAGTGPRTLSVALELVPEEGGGEPVDGEREAPESEPEGPRDEGGAPGGTVEPPVRIETVEPDYPAAARRAGVGGMVVLAVEVGADGRVGDVEVIRGRPLGLTKAAIEAVRQWRFEPARRDGEPIVMTTTVTVVFDR